jgi:tetrahydromethanopterin S-methyltransferase subunit G
MTIWILALVLFAILAAVGYALGAIRVGFSLLGLVVASLLTSPLTKLATPIVKFLLALFSVKNPLVIWAVAPVVAFLFVLTLFKIGGKFVHHKIEVHFKYKAGELQFALWERMNKRVGACLGIINGLVYLLLISLVLYVLAYTTTQMAINEDGPKLVRLVNRAGHDVQATGLVQAVRAIDPAPASYYEAADIVGMVYHNPLTQGRLARYPIFLSMSERPEFQALSTDKEFLEMLDRQAPVPEILANQKTKDILNNAPLLNEIWGQVGTDLHDLHDYLNTGVSAKYGSEPLLGRWNFDVAATSLALRQNKASLSAIEKKKLSSFLVTAFGRAMIVAMPDKKLSLKNYLGIKPGEVVKPEDLTNLKNTAGTWENLDAKYSLAFDDFKEMSATIENGRLKINTPWSPLIFTQDE